MQKVGAYQQEDRQHFRRRSEFEHKVQLVNFGLHKEKVAGLECGNQVAFVKESVTVPIAVFE